jgi:multicomponent Na+:H+ antiporter subunit B
LVPAFLATLTGLLLAVAVSDLPVFGDPKAPIHNHVAPEYIIGSEQAIGVPNIVTSVLASYRSFDTFGETLVVFTAAIAVLLIIGGYTRAPRRAKGKRKGSQDAG